jgi:hypothetical protein
MIAASSSSSRRLRPEPIRDLLAAGRRPLDAGRVGEVTELIARHPRRLGGLVQCLWDENAGVANRAADALERLTAGPAPRIDPRRLVPWKDALLSLLAEAEFNKLRWNLAFTLPRLPLTVAEAQRAAWSLYGYLDDPGSIVKTAAMQGLADLTRHNPSLLPEVLDRLRILSRSGTPAMRARGRILLKRLEPRPEPGLRRKQAARQSGS